MLEFYAPRVATVKLDLTKEKYRCTLLNVKDLTQFEAWYAHYNEQYLRIELIELVRDCYTGTLCRKRVYFKISEDEIRYIVEYSKHWIYAEKQYVRTVADNKLYRTRYGYIEIAVTPQIMNDLCEALFKLTLRHVALEKHLDWLNYSGSEFGKKRRECGKGVYNFRDTYYGATRTSHRYILEEDAFDDIHKLYEDGMYYEED